MWYILVIHKVIWLKMIREIIENHAESLLFMSIIFAGIANYIQKVQKNKTKFAFFCLFIDVIACGFVGYMTYLIFEYFGFSIDNKDDAVIIIITCSIMSHRGSMFAYSIGNKLLKKFFDIDLSDLKSG